MIEKFNSWREILSLNTTNLPPIIGGMPRSGTTFAYRNLWVEQGTSKYFLEEYFNPFYSFNYNDTEPKITIDRQTIQNNFLKNNKINSSDKDVSAYRYKQLCSIGLDKGFLKVSPNNLHTLSENDLIHISKNHFWILIIRPNWVDCMFSNLYSQHFNKYHYYGDEKLLDQTFEVSYNSIDDYLNLFHLMYQQSLLQTNKVILYTSQFTNLENTFEGDNLRMPRHDKNKKELYPRIIKNYKLAIEYANKKILTILEKTNGWLSLDMNNEIRVK
jgi:hypothetical protein